MGGTLALQNGWYRDIQGTTEGEQLHSEGRPQRCILHNPNTHRSPTLPEVHSEAGTLSVHMLPIRLVVYPMRVGIHQSDKTSCDLLCVRRVQMIPYIDNILLIADTAAQAESHLEALTFLMTGLEFIINVQKSITTSTQQIEFLGLKVDSVPLHLSPLGKTPPYKDGGQTTLQRPQVTVRWLVQLIGKLHAASQADLLAPLF